ncbi:hypothetical protein ANN_10240, partial [Periplaneta americana]
MWLSLVFLHLVVHALGYNVSPRDAIVFQDPVSQPEGYFGFSVALQKHWLLVGAPRANSSHPDIAQPGVLYQCPLDGAASCSAQLLDAAGNDRNDTLQYQQHKDGAWVGGALDQLGSRIVVCGSRWTNYYYTKDNNTYVNGICYITNVNQSASQAEKMLPLLARINQTFMKTTYLYAFAQMGFSAHFVEGDGGLVLGAPGVLDWTGTLLRFDAGDFAHPTVPNPYKLELTQYGYLGYSLASGRFVNRIMYVSGAPRAGAAFQGRVYVLDVRNDALNVVATVSGSQTGEYFGAALAVADVNGDGLPDVLVGAPLYGTEKHWNRGRLVVHLAKQEKGKLSFTDSYYLDGPRRAGAQFGTAVAALGDLDKDGYEDFVVGAPYEDAGVIYVYHGSAHVLRQASQRIPSASVQQGLRGFGISFSRGVDVDDNGVTVLKTHAHVTDFAVGAYQSGHAVVLKTLPVVTCEATLSSSSGSIGLDTTGFNVTSCVACSSKFASSKLDMLDMILKLDNVYMRVLPRDINYTEALDGNRRHCREHKVRIERSLQAFQPIDMRLTYQLHTEPRKKKRFCSHCPVIDPRSHKAVIHQVSYVRGCNADDVCNPDLSISADFLNVTMPFTLGSRPGVNISIKVRNAGEPAFRAYVTVKLPPGVPPARVPEICGHTDGSLRCLLANPMIREARGVVILDVDLRDVASGTESLEFALDATSDGVEVTPADNSQRLELKLETRANLSLTGIPSREEVVHFKHNSTDFTHMYEVHNLGPSRLERVHLELQVPSLVELRHVHAGPEGIEVSCVRSDQSARLLVASNASQPGPRRWPADRVLNVTCLTSGVVCVTVNCSIGSPFESQTRSVVTLEMTATSEHL